MCFVSHGVRFDVYSIAVCVNSMHQHAGEKETHRQDFTVLRWFKMFYKINVDRVAYAAPRKDYRSLQDEEQRRQRAQDEIQQRLMEEGARVKALEALKHREEETIEHVTWQWLRCRTCAAARIGI